MSEQQSAGQQDDAPKWGDSLDKLSQKRKDELAERLWAWKPEMATEKRHGPFAGEELNGLEVFWLAICALPAARRDMVVAEQRLRAVADDEFANSIRLDALHLERAYLLGPTWSGPPSAAPTWKGLGFTKRAWRGPSSPRRTWSGPISAIPT